MTIEAQMGCAVDELDVATMRGQNATVPAVAPAAMRWPVLDADHAVRAYRADAPPDVSPAAVLDRLGAADDPRYECCPLLVDATFAAVREWLDEHPAEIRRCVLPVLPARVAQGPDDEVQAWVWSGRRFALRIEPDAPLPEPRWLALASFVLVPLALAEAGEPALRGLVTALHAQTPAEVIADQALSPALVRLARAVGCDAWVGPADYAGGWSPTRASALRLLARLADERTAPPAIATTIAEDALLTTHLLAWLGRAELHGYGETSVTAAVRLLGTHRLQQWAAALALAGESDAPTDALERALVRAALCAEAARLGAPGGDGNVAWLVGLLAELPLLLNRWSGPEAMPAAVAELGLGGELRAGLVDDTHALGRLRLAACAYERGDWSAVRASGLGAVLADAYLGALLVAGATIAQWRAGPTDTGRRP